MEDPEAFKATHELLLELIRKGQVTGLRLDHIDGLAKPVEYLQRLQKSITHDTGMDEPTDARGFYVLVEKITMEGEALPSHWPVAGTTGYEFAREVTRLLLDSSGEPEITRIYQEFTGNAQPVGPSVQAAKKLVMGLAMSKEINGLTLMLRRCAEQRPEFRDLLYEDLCSAVRETIACLSVYRSYRTSGEPISPQDRKGVRDAIAGARQANPELEPLARDFLQQLLLNEPELNPPASELEERFITRFQQTTGGVMAKGFEDTVFFAYNRLIALNEVGGNPAAFGMSVEQFHALNAERLKSWPDMMLTTSTHDTKTSEDVRARLAAISELGGEWESFLKQSREINGPLKSKIGDHLAPDGNEEYLLYQILVGSWPLEAFPLEARKDYLTRIQAYMTKALNEAKINTRWDRRNHEWEAAVMKFVEGIILSPKPEFEKVFSAFFTKVAELGAVNSLNQVLLKMTVPGVPDFYQGNELWQYILVDPDNRRQIDYPLRQRMLKEIQGKSTVALLTDWREGGIKMFLTKTVLRFRQEHREIFQRGTYEPIRCTGTYADCCLAFARTWGGQTVIVLTIRASHRLGTFPLGDKWGETMAEIPALPGTKLRNLFTHAEHLGGPMRLADAFRELPFAVLVTLPNALPSA
jgi:(1->4)-alpha-D-glucan 1-alpha-D-glucosylmutase